MTYRERFDYKEMAAQAQRECEALQKRLEYRKNHRPTGSDEELRWKRENSILYDMYLEQRQNAGEFTRRAQDRGQL